MFLNYGIVLLIASSSACVLVDIDLQLFHAAFFTSNTCAPPHTNEGAAWQGQGEAQAQLKMGCTDPAAIIQMWFLECCES